MSKNVPQHNVFVPGAFGKEAWWISGGTTGIGHAVALALARLGARLVISGRQGNNLETARMALLKAGAQQVVACALPLGTADTAERVRTALVSLGMPLTNAMSHKSDVLAGVLLNGPGPHGGSLESLEPKDFDTAHELLLKGPALLLSAVFPYLKKPGASVVAITSTTVREPNTDLPLSAAYRTALVALLKNAALTWGPLGVRVNNVAPGYTATDRLDEFKSYVAEQNAEGADAVEARWAALAALKRIATPDEIAQAVLFLFSDAASFVTGQTLVVDGGQVRGY